MSEKYPIMRRKKYHVLFNLTWDCQRACPYCWIRLMKGKGDAENSWGGIKPIASRWDDELSIDEWIRIFNVLPPSLIDISGGEPTLIKGFSYLVRNINRKHDLALSTNLMGDAYRMIKNTKERWIGVNCSYHGQKQFELDTFIRKVRALMRHIEQGVAVNIVDFYLSPSDRANIRIMREAGLKVNVSPFEDPRLIEHTGKVLRCNAGFNTFVFNPNGDVFRCLTWFRFGGKPIGDLRDRRTLKPFNDVRTCDLKCDIYYTLDPHHVKKNMFSTYVKEAY